ncbi:MAG TPA: hypothetical protein VFA45_06350, partial [Actinomycetes bacterium]|nr:hypothetical protein [Actinomycetes bacterium]
GRVLSRAVNDTSPNTNKGNPNGPPTRHPHPARRLRPWSSSLRLSPYNAEGDRLVRIHPATNRVAASIRLPGDLGGDRGGVLVGRDWVWVSNPPSFTVYRIDPRHDRLTGDSFEAVGGDLAAAGGLVWVQADGTRLIGLRPGEAARTIFVPQSLGNQATMLAAGPQTLWAATDTAVLVRFDLRAVPEQRRGCAARFAGVCRVA